MANSAIVQAANQAVNSLYGKMIKDLDALSKKEGTLFEQEGMLVQMLAKYEHSLVVNPLFGHAIWNIPELSPSNKEAEILRNFDAVLDQLMENIRNQLLIFVDEHTRLLGIEKQIEESGGKVERFDKKIANRLLNDFTYVREVLTEVFEEVEGLRERFQKGMVKRLLDAKAFKDSLVGIYQLLERKNEMYKDINKQLKISESFAYASGLNQKRQQG